MQGIRSCAPFQSARHPTDSEQNRDSEPFHQAHTMMQPQVIAQSAQQCIPCCDAHYRPQVLIVRCLCSGVDLHALWQHAPDLHARVKLLSCRLCHVVIIAGCMPPSWTMCQSITWRWIFPLNKTTSVCSIILYQFVARGYWWACFYNGCIISCPWTNICTISSTLCRCHMKLLVVAGVIGMRHNCNYMTHWVPAEWSAPCMLVGYCECGN